VPVMAYLSPDGAVREASFQLPRHTTLLAHLAPCLASRCSALPPQDQFFEAARKYGIELVYAPACTTAWLQPVSASNGFHESRIAKEARLKLVAIKASNFLSRRVRPPACCMVGAGGRGSLAALCHTKSQGFRQANRSRATFT
jgi:hypothetical protein